MKILQICAAYKPAYIYGGPTMSVSKLSEELVKAGLDIEVYTTTANGADELSVRPGEPTMVDGVKTIYFRRVTGDHIHYSPALLRALRQQAKHFDVIHIHAWWNLVSLLACRIALEKKVPVIISPRGTLSTYSFGNRNSLAKRLLHDFIGKQLLASSYFHVTSFREEHAIKSLGPSKGVYNIPNFVNFPPAIPASEHRADGPLRLLFLSRIEEKKGLDILFAALSGIAIPYTLTVAGDGESGYVSALKRLAENLGIADRIEWLGFVKEEKFKLLAGHELLVLPSHDENFGNVIIESLSVGTAVLVSDKVGLAGYVGQQQAGWICDNAPDAFREELTGIYGNRHQLTAIRSSAPKRIRKDYDEQFLTERYISMYKDILDESI